MDGLLDKRMHQVSAQCAPVDEVMALEALYRERYDSWTVAHFYERYAEEHKGGRSYSWVKRRLQASGLVKVGQGQGQTSAETGTKTTAWNDAASGWFHAPLAGSGQ